MYTCALSQDQPHRLTVHKAEQLTCHRDLSDRPSLANQHMQTRHTTLSTNSFFIYYLAVQWTLANWRGQVIWQLSEHLLTAEARLSGSSVNSCSLKRPGYLAVQWTLAHWRGQVIWQFSELLLTAEARLILHEWEGKTFRLIFHPRWHRHTFVRPQVSGKRETSFSPSETLIIPLVSWINMCHVVHTVLSCSLSMMVSISTKASVNSDHTCMHHQYET